ncbi:MAG: sigma-70 family RNA polymerase sigma factor [Verrucomicrobiota bacterium]|nr:sigma-70 family RNA polymerase sigma factor [Verrucomicrobiota bacterium]
MQETDQDSLFVSELTRAQAKMRIYLAKLLANSPSTDDVLQECNKVLWVKRSDWKPETIFLKWAYRVCFFQVKAYFRNQSREKLVFNDELLDLLGSEEPDNSGSKEIEDAMNKCLDKINSQERSLLLERYQGEMSVEQLAKREGLQPNTLSQKLLRLRHQLLVCIQANLKTI